MTTLDFDVMFRTAMERRDKNYAADGVSLGRLREMIPWFDRLFILYGVPLDVQPWVSVLGRLVVTIPECTQAKFLGFCRAAGTVGFRICYRSLSPDRFPTLTFCHPICPNPLQSLLSLEGYPGTSCQRVQVGVTEVPVYELQCSGDPVPTNWNQAVDHAVSPDGPTKDPNENPNG